MSHWRAEQVHFGAMMESILWNIDDWSCKPMLARFLKSL